MDVPSGTDPTNSRRQILDYRNCLYTANAAAIKIDILHCFHKAQLKSLHI